MSECKYARSTNTETKFIRFRLLHTRSSQKHLTEKSLWGNSAKWLQSVRVINRGLRNARSRKERPAPALFGEKGQLRHWHLKANSESRNYGPALWSTPKTFWRTFRPNAVSLKSPSSDLTTQVALASCSLPSRKEMHLERCKEMRS